jgi:hypothetical protein
MSLATNYRLGPQIYQFTTDSFGEFVLIVLGCVVLVVMAQHQLHRVGLYAQRHIFRNKRASLIESAFPDFCYQPFLTSKDVATKIETTTKIENKDRDSHVSFTKTKIETAMFLFRKTKIETAMFLSPKIETAMFLSQRSRQPCFFHMFLSIRTGLFVYLPQGYQALTIKHSTFSL